MRVKNQLAYTGEIVGNRLLKKFLILTIFCSGLLCVHKAEAQIDILNNAASDKVLSYLMISNRDVGVYKNIFKAIENNNLAKADALVKKLDSYVLLGHVKAEKYLHKNYKTSYNELKKWLEEYGDHPQAAQIYQLAVRKGGEEGLVKPEKLLNRQKIWIYGWKNQDIEHLSENERSYIIKEVTKFRRYMSQGKTKPARNVLEQPRFRKLVPNKYWDDMAATLAFKYFLDNYDGLASEWAAKAARRGTSETALWVGGLSAYRKHNYKNAAAYFSKLGNKKGGDEWLVAGGAYWSAMANEKLSRPGEVRKELLKAAKYKHTFYGILAGYRLGSPLIYNWDAVAYLNNFDNYDYVYELLASPSIRRAIILIKAKNMDLAEKELRYGFEAMNDKQKEASLFLANQYKMHSLAIFISNKMKSVEDGIAYDDVAYPVPSWKPSSGWKIDQPLLLALARQESAFNPIARSHAGATGLMQLMPNTAVHITKNKSLKKDKTPLLKAEYNLELGQQYVTYLLDKPFINGNLFFMMTAYNGGPGNLLKWQKKMNYMDMPLMFIETIPAAETRIYIERVMANYWIYNARFGVENTTLEQIAKGKWPQIEK